MRGQVSIWDTLLDSSRQGTSGWSLEQYMYLCDAAVLAADDPREGVRESGGVGADQRARLVHVGAQLEELKRNTFFDNHAHLPLRLT